MDEIKSENETQNVDELFKVTPAQGEFLVTPEDIMKYTFPKENDDLFKLFINSIVKLKTDINARYVKVDRELNNVPFNIKDVPLGKMEPHAFGMIVALKLFINWYAETFTNSNIKGFIDASLYIKKDDLFFTSFGDRLNNAKTAEEFDKFNNITDALCVKFYQTVMYYLHAHFNSDEKVLIVKATDKGYLFRFRGMSIAEMGEYKQGKLLINREE